MVSPEQNTDEVAEQKAILDALNKEKAQAEVLAEAQAEARAKVLAEARAKAQAEAQAKAQVEARARPINPQSPSPNGFTESAQHIITEIMRNRSDSTLSFLNQLVPNNGPLGKMTNNMINMVTKMAKTPNNKISANFGQYVKNMPQTLSREEKHASIANDLKAIKNQKNMPKGDSSQKNMSKGDSPQKKVPAFVNYMTEAFQEKLQGPIDYVIPGQEKVSISAEDSKRIFKQMVVEQFADFEPLTMENLDTIKNSVMIGLADTNAREVLVKVTLDKSDLESINKEIKDSAKQTMNLTDGKISEPKLGTKVVEEEQNSTQSFRAPAPS